MKHLQTLYPPGRVQRKREELDRLATTYVEKLFGFLPCLDLANKSAVEPANDILLLAIHIQQVQRIISGEITQPLQGAGDEASEKEEAAPAELSEVERNEMIALITQYGVIVMRDDATNTTYISHSTIQGRAMALNERELYDIVLDIVSRVSAA